MGRSLSNLLPDSTGDGLKVLHLFSNYRMTGPAEPALNLCLTLQRRGWDVLLACHKPPKWIGEDFTAVAESLGIKTHRGFNLTKHFRLFDNISDVGRLRGFLDSGKIDILHVHMTNDHLVGGWAARRCERPVKVIRSSYEGGGMQNSLRNRLLLGKLTDALIVHSKMAAEADARRFGFDPQKIFLCDGAVDIHRFNSDRNLPPIRAELGLADDDFVIGIVARIQLRRRFDDLLGAVKIAACKIPNLKLMIVGRGTRMHEAVVEPTLRMGLGGRVVFAGYHRGDDYVRVLEAMDVKIFLVPGTDGSCRAVREAMAVGRPVIAAARGMLPEIVEDGVTGLIVDGSAGQLAEAILRLAGDAELRCAMAQAALKKARSRFTLEHQAQQIEAVYLSDQ